MRAQALAEALGGALREPRLTLRVRLAHAILGRRTANGLKAALNQCKTAARRVYERVRYASDANGGSPPGWAGL